MVVEGAEQSCPPRGDVVLSVNNALLFSYFSTAFKTKLVQSPVHRRRNGSLGETQETGPPTEGELAPLIPPWTPKMLKDYLTWGFLWFNPHLLKEG